MAKALKTISSTGTEGQHMSTFQLPEDAELAAALGLLAAHLEHAHDLAARSVHELRNAAQPGNGWPGPGSVPHADRERIAAAARVVAAGHPEHAERLEGLAAGLEGSLAHLRANGARI